MNSLVLSIFPGIDGLGRGFERSGFCVVRGPDLLWGGDVREFHPPAGAFCGVIGGPPCQMFSSLAHLLRATGREPRFGNLIPEFERVVAEARSAWYLMENVPAAPIPGPVGYHPPHSFLLNNRWLGGEQNRVRRFSFGVRDDCEPHQLDLSPDLVALESPLAFPALVGSERQTPVKIGGSGKVKSTLTSGNGFDNSYQNRHKGIHYPKNIRPYGNTVTAAHAGGPSGVTVNDGAGRVKMVRYSLAEAAELQGFPPDFLADAPFTKEGKMKAIANAVPRWMAEALARAVKAVMSEVAS